MFLYFTKKVRQDTYFSNLNLYKKNNLALRKHGSNLQQPDWVLQGTKQTAPFSILQTNRGGYINAYQIKQHGMVQSSPKPSHHIATDENRKIRNRRSCL